MIYLKEMIKATDETIVDIVRREIIKLGLDADLNHIDVSGVTNMNHLFWTSQFNGDISNWDVGNVTNMRWMFNESKFNRDISNWNVGNALHMRSMFNSSHFNGDISGWNVGNVVDMYGMFSNSKFNRDISNWNVGNVQNMYVMFRWSQFNGDISGWNVGNVQDMTNMFQESLLYEREPWWYILSPLFGSTHLLWDSLDFGWINIEGKVIYRDKLIKTFRRGYNTKFNVKLPEVFGFTYK